ncbi:MAG: hypothetical protein ABI723_04975 [Bacteroidia bacterium]
MKYEIESGVKRISKRIFVVIFIATANLAFSGSNKCKCQTNKIEKSILIDDSLAYLFMKWKEDSLGCKGKRIKLWRDILNQIYKFQDSKELKHYLGDPNLIIGDSISMVNNSYNYIYFVDVSCSSDSVLLKVDKCYLRIFPVLKDSINFSGFYECE